MQHKKRYNIKEDNLLGIKNHLNINSLQPAQNYFAIKPKPHQGIPGFTDGGKSKFLSARDLDSVLEHFPGWYKQY